METNRFKPSLKGRSVDRFLKAAYILCVPLFTVFCTSQSWLFTKQYAIPELASLSPFFCVFKWITHLKCPGCGMTHAMVSFFSLDWVAAFSYNPFSIFLGLGFCYIWFRLVRDFSFSWQSWLMQSPRFLSWGVCIILVSWGVIRNIINL